MENPEKSREVYSALRDVYLGDSERSKSDEDLLEVLEDYCEVSEGKPLFSKSKLVSAWIKLWDAEVEGLSDPGEKRQEFIETYIQVYISKIEESSLEDMLVHDFFQGLAGLCRDEGTKDWLEMWFLTLKQNYESVQNPKQIARNTVERMSMKK